VVHKAGGVARGVGPEFKLQHCTGTIMVNLMDAVTALPELMLSGGLFTCGILFKSYSSFMKYPGVFKMLALT
jgi:hypothetical protein